jgi:hypothetical protein
MGGVVLSSDDFFVDADTGEYNWNQGGLRKAHVWNQERARLECERCSALVVIDNCSLTVHDAVPYAELALQHGYELAIVDAEQGNASDVELAERNVHGVPKEAIAELRLRYERYTVADLVALVKRSQPGEDSKETQALRKKYREKLLRRQDVAAAVAPATGPAAKVRIEGTGCCCSAHACFSLWTAVCRNDGQANPCKPIVVASADTLRSVCEAACKKLALSFNAKKSVLYDTHGQVLEKVLFAE